MAEWQILLHQKEGGFQKASSVMTNDELS
jgi:hypothetical protein